MFCVVISILIYSNSKLLELHYDDVHCNPLVLFNFLPKAIYNFPGCRLVHYMNDDSLLCFCYTRDCFCNLNFLRLFT